MESLYQRGWRLAKEGHGISNLWGNCSKDSEMEEVLRGMEAYWRGQAAPVTPAGGVQFVGYPPVPEDRKLPPAGDVEAVCEVVDEKYNRVQFYRQTGDTSKPYHRPGEKLYDQACVTRLTAERDSERKLRKDLAVRVHEMSDEIKDLKGERDGLLAALEARKAKHIRSCQLAIGKSQLAKHLQSELTKALEDLRLEKLAGAAMHKQAEDFKALSWERGQELDMARELLTVNARDFEGVRRALAAFHKENQEQWCGYLDDSLGICLFRIKELAAFLTHQSAPAAKCSICNGTGVVGDASIGYDQCFHNVEPAAKGGSK